MAYTSSAKIAAEEKLADLLDVAEDWE